MEGGGGSPIDSSASISSPKDIANLKSEIEKKQKEDGAGESSSPEAVKAITENGAESEAAAPSVPAAAPASVQVKS